MKRQKFYWALGVLVMLTIIWFCYKAAPPTLDPDPTAQRPEETEQHDATHSLKAPPQGETFATGYWEGEQWHRTAPPAPVTVMHEGKAMTLKELYRYAYRACSENWTEESPF